MRTASIGLVLLLTACGTTPKAAEPRIQLSPYYAGYRLGGKLGMQNNPGTGPVGNDQQSMRAFGQDRYEDDWGLRADFGDGVSGARAEWARLTMNPTDTGVLGDDFGSLAAGATTHMDATVDEYKLGYLHEVWTGRGGPQQYLCDIKIAVGGIVAHRAVDLAAHDVNLGTQQRVELRDDGVVYPAMQFRAKYQAFALDLGYAISPWLQLGGDFRGILQDIDFRLSYTVPFQDVSLFAGYHYSTLPVDATQDGLAVDGDLRIDGFQLGVTVSF